MCSYYSVLVNKKQQSGKILAQHLFACRLAPLSVQRIA